MLSIDDFKLITNIYLDGFNKDLSNIWTFLHKLQECIVDKDVKVIENCRFQIHHGRVLLSVCIPKDIRLEGKLQFKEDQIPMLSYYRIEEDGIFGYYEVSTAFESTMKEKIDKILDIKNDTGYFTKTKRIEVENVLNELLDTSSNMNHLVIIIHKLLSKRTVESRDYIFDLILWAIDNSFSKQVDDINEDFDGFQSMSITNFQESRNTSIKEITSLLSVFSIAEKDTGSIASQSNSVDIQSTNIIKEVIPKSVFFLQVNDWLYNG
jgi:regulator of RNase E activity RraB